MTAVAMPATPVVVPLVPVAVPNASKPANMDGLPPPLLDDSMPGDVLGMFMALMEDMARTGMDGSENKILADKEKLHAAMEEFQKKMEEIARKAAEPKKDSGWGIFGDIVNAVSDFIGDICEDVLGPVVETMVDYLRAPIDIIVGLCQGENIQALFEQELSDITTQGKLSDTIGGAAKGLVDLVRDLNNAMSSFVGDLVAGRDPFEALGDLASDAWNALCTNVLDNPAVMEVLGTALKVVAIATAVMSGGTLGLVAAGLYLLSEADQRLHLSDKLPGDSGKWVSLGIQVAGAVCGAVATFGASSAGSATTFFGDSKEAMELVDTLQQVSGYLNAGLSVASGVRTFQLAEKAADQIDDHADLMQILNRMAALQRMIDAVLTDLEERTEGRDRMRQGGQQVAELQAEGMEAAVSFKG